MIPRFWTPWQQTAWLLLFCVIGGAAAYGVRSPWQLVPLLGVLGWLTWASTVYAFDHSLWIPAYPPLLGMVLSAGLVTIYVAYLESTDRLQLMDIFKRNVSRDVAQSLWDQRSEFARHGRPTPQKLIATVLFTDLKDFTTFSENLDPPSLLEWLNSYMSLMAEQVDQHGGVVMKYMGDALMAVFGVPRAAQDRGGIQCRCRQRRPLRPGHAGRLEKFNAEQAAKGKPPTSMRVGIFTGSLVAGCMGSADRLEYSTLGDTVNTAARLESFDKEKGMEPPTHCRILIGEPTLSRIGSTFATLKIDTIRMKGKTETTTVYRVLHEIKSDARS